MVPVRWGDADWFGVFCSVDATPAGSDPPSPPPLEEPEEPEAPDEPPAPSSMWASTSPTATFSPSGLRIFVNRPAAGAVTSLVALSVSSSTIT